MQKGLTSEPSIRMRVVVICAALLAGFISGLVSEKVLSPRQIESLHSREDGGIGIPALVQQVREELIASDIQRTQANMPSLFTAKSVDLEISFVAKKSDTLGSKVTLQVVDVDAKRTISSEQAQKMTIHLDIQQPEELSISPSFGRNHK